MNGKGDKQRVKWSKEFEENYNKIFKEKIVEEHKDIITLKMKVESRNVLDKRHWAEKKEEGINKSGHYL